MEKILVVDDSTVQASRLKAILEGDYDVVVAQTAEDGLRLASRESFSLILLDVVMPGMDGFTLLKKLQEEVITQSVPVILITSLSDEEDEQHGLGTPAWSWGRWTTSASPLNPSSSRPGSTPTSNSTTTAVRWSTSP